MINMIRDGINPSLDQPSFDRIHERLRVAKVHLWKSAYSAFMRIQDKKNIFT